MKRKPPSASASTTRSAMESPAKTSRMPQHGNGAKLAGVLACRGRAGVFITPPLPMRQLRGGQSPTSAAGAARGCLPSRCTSNSKLVRIIDVEADARHFQDDQLLAGLLHGLAMRQKAVVAEAQRNDRRRPAQNAVAAAPVVGRHEDRAFRRGRVQHAMQFVAGDERDVGRHDNGGVVACAARTTRSPSRWPRSRSRCACLRSPGSRTPRPSPARAHRR